jgi:hypothetical protein
MSMPEQSHGADDVLGRLTEIERRLTEIQADLMPAGGGGETVAQATVTAGPFASTADVQAFERALGEIPGVTEVSVRGYQGSSHAVFEVRLA